jgi:uncharacterized membrane protein YqgA involved in biofilm formation
MTGTLVNLAGIVAGTLIGSLLKKGIPEAVSHAVIRAQGLAVGIIGLNGVIVAMFVVKGNGLSDRGSLLLLISLVVGCLVGELLKLDDRLNALGDAVERKTGKGNFSKGFVSATLVFCIGAMSIVGSLNEGLTGDANVLYVKAMLDFTTAIVLSSTLGFGVGFAAIPVLGLQGAITLLAHRVAPYITDELLRNISMTGYALVLCLGINFLLNAKIKVANLLPSLLVPILYGFFV